MRRYLYPSSVFINCPFDRQYQNIFDALIFAVFDCGFVPHCAMEIDDGSQIRIEKIFNIIEGCKFSIHDISRTELDPGTRLPRFNMPLELGMFLGAKRFGGKKQKEKNCMVMDRERYRFQQYISDIAGQDIKAHNDEPEKVVRLVRDWLNSTTKRRTIPGGPVIWRRYESYTEDLPGLCDAVPMSVDDMTFNDKATFASEWLKENY